MSGKTSAIIWDFNGTIVDDVTASLKSVNGILQKRSLPLININQYYSYIDTPIIKFYENILDLKKEDFEIISKEFSYGYNKHMVKDCLMENVEKVLEYAKELGIEQYLLSSSNEELVKKAVETLGVSKFFKVISGAKNHRAESKIARGNRLIAENKLDTDQLLIVGDTLHDYIFAKEIKSQCILTTKGHQGIEQFKGTSATIVEDLIEVKNYL